MFPAKLGENPRKGGCLLQALPFSYTHLKAWYFLPALHKQNHPGWLVFCKAGLIRTDSGRCMESVVTGKVI